MAASLWTDQNAPARSDIFACPRPPRSAQVFFSAQSCANYMQLNIKKNWALVSWPDHDDGADELFLHRFDTDWPTWPLIMSAENPF